MKKRLTGTLAVMVCFSMLTACAANPNQGAVTSKNDGVFQANVTQQATGPVDEQVQISEVFTSTDKTAEYTVNINGTVTTGTLPVVEVVPHYITGEEVQNVATVLFGNAEFYKRQHEAKQQDYSKAQLQQKLDLLTPLASEEAVIELYGSLDKEVLNNVQADIQKYTVQMESASEKNPLTPCDWNFTDESDYFEFSNGNQIIFATVTHNGVNYNIYALTRDKNDYKQNVITVNLDYSWYEEAAVRASLCRTEKPTEDQIYALEMKAQEMLNQMELGQWQVCGAEVTTNIVGDIAEYTITINAAPVLHGTPVIYGQSISDLTSTDANASNYQMTSATFVFSTNGDLITFGMISPIEISKVVNESVATLSASELMENAKSHLSLYGVASGFGIPYDVIDGWQTHYGEPLSCKLEISEMKYGLARVKVPDSDFHYYYIPVMVLYSSVDFYGKNTGTLYFRSEEFFDSRMQDLIWINAVDGSIISGT